VPVGIWQQGQVARALDRGGKLALVLGLGRRDATRHDLAGFAQILLQQVEILVVDLLDALGAEAAETLAAEET
jgi:hypothetical protein